MIGDWSIESTRRTEELLDTDIRRCSQCGRSDGEARWVGRKKSIVSVTVERRSGNSWAPENLALFCNVCRKPPRRARKAKGATNEGQIPLFTSEQLAECAAKSA